MLWIKAFHIILMVTWFAGLFYLPRLFVYHADALDQPSLIRFKLMEKRLYILMSIGAVGTALFGFWMLAAYAWAAWSAFAWLHIKMLLVVVLFGYHLYLGKLVIDFRHDRNQHSQRYYRWLNEFPSLILIAVVILAVAKPF